MVTRNAMLMIRFMVYLAEAIVKPGRFATILDVWHHVQTSNAVNDILAGSPSLKGAGHQHYHQRQPYDR
ncbi:hypothetical protein [Streptomyces sp. NPDC007984]|uniref:hypothetical protein n=1 Tax=Streptomyces sp. NPDC007984 TaxID=3364801 RepID=UPI0036E999C5